MACLGVAATGIMAAGSLALPLRFASARPRFEPRSVTFISSHTGWVLGTVPCAHQGPCLALRETTDAGRSWFARRFPASLAAAAKRKINGLPSELIDGVPLSIHFADPRDGWIYGALAVPARQAGISYSIEPALWSTHDGGMIWRQQPPRTLGPGGEGTILNVQSAAGTAYMMEATSTYDVIVKSSPVGADRWRLSSGAVHLGHPAGGSLQSGAFVLQGRSGWLVEGNDRGTTGSAQLNGRGQWVNWTPPCASLGGTFAIPAASTPQDLVAMCVMGGFASQLPSSAPSGATLGSSWLYFSSDGGKTFNAGPELGPQGSFFSDVLASPSADVIFIDDEHGLTASFDGGAQWSVVYRGQPSSLAFTGPSQGVGIVQSSNQATRMIMTLDGGHTWTPVTF
jgi:hypothetical protein